MSEEPRVPHVPDEGPLPPPPPPAAPSASSSCRQVFFGLVGFCAGFTAGVLGAMLGGGLYNSSDTGLAVALVVTTLVGVGGVVLAVRGPWKPLGIGIALGAAACGLLIAACWNFSLKF